MNVNTNFCNLSTHYNANIEQIVKDHPHLTKAINLNMRGAPCFGTLFHRIKENSNTDTGTDILRVLYKGNVEIFMCDTVILKERHHGNNFCFFSKQEIEIWLNYIKKLIPYRYKINSKVQFNPLKDNIASIEGISITLSFNNLSFLEFKLLLTLIRYLYEQPAALILKDVLNLMKAGIIKSHNIFNIYNFITIGIQTNSSQDVNFGGYYYPAISIKDFRKKIIDLKLESTTINDIFKAEKVKSLKLTNFKLNKDENNSFFTHNMYALQSLVSKECNENQISIDASILRYKKYYIKYVELYKGIAKNIISFKTRFNR